MKCVHCGSQKDTRNSVKWSRIVCGKHRRQLDLHGKVFTSNKEPNEIRIRGGLGYISLYQQSKAGTEREKIGEAIIDAAHLREARRYHWHLSWNGYVVSSGKKTRLHHLILKPRRGYDIDHINENKLDNRRSNLRYATRAQNIVNQRRIRGVRMRNGKFCPRIVVNGEVKLLGRYSTLAEAMRVRRRAELKHYGQFAPRR